MTYDPNDPRNPNRLNDGRYRTDGMTGGTMLAIAIAAVLGLGIMLWAMSGDNRTASTNPPSTVGQSTETPRPGSPPMSNPGPSDRVPTTAPKAQ